MKRSTRSTARPGTLHRDSSPVVCPGRGASRGQIVPEYAIGVCLVVLALIGLLAALQVTLERFHDRQASWLSLPFP